MFLGSIIHVLVIPYLDLTLIAVNTTLGIIFSVLLSTFVLKEQFIPIYDVSGLLFILAGVVMIVLNANTSEQKFTDGQALNLLLSWQSFVFLSVNFGLFGFNSCMLKRFLLRLRRFETDVDIYDQQQLELHASSKATNKKGRLL